MAAKKKDESLVTGILGFGVIIAFLARSPGILFAAIAIAVVLWVFKKIGEAASSPTPPPPPPRRADVGSANIRVEFSSAPRASRQWESAKFEFESRWIPPGKSEAILGLTIPGGMLYVGKHSSVYEAPPELINARVQVSAQGQDVTIDPSGYFGSYSRLSPVAARTYLQWIEGGRQNPQAHIGFVFLAFYALERRVLEDMLIGKAGALEDIPAIQAEINRLLVIYGSNGSFRSYARSLLDFIGALKVKSGLEDYHPSAPTESLKIRLGKLLANDELIPGNLAFAWVQSGNTFAVTRAMSICPNEFETEFLHSFHDKFGDGIRAAAPRLRLKVSHLPASSNLRSKNYEISLKDIPDVSSASNLIKKIQVLVDSVVLRLQPYARYVKKAPDQSSSLDGVLLLPTSCWPSTMRQALNSLDARVGTGLSAMKLGELAGHFGSSKTLSRDRVQALIVALEEGGIGFEPDVLSGARTPKSDDHVVLFRAEREDSQKRTSATYRAACVTLDLACVVVNVDGKVTAAELRQLTSYVDSLSSLPNAQRLRLRARVKAGITDTPTLASLRKQIEQIPEAARRHVGHLLSTMAMADGEVPVAEIKMLEKIYKALGLEIALVHSDLHEFAAALQSPASGSSQGQAQPSVVKPIQRPQSKAAETAYLDLARVAALQADTAKVAALLANVFVEDEPSMPAAEVVETSDGADDNAPRLLDLDEEHDAFLRFLLSRPEWSRTDLSSAASDMELMLEGALEKINEAAFDKLGEGLIEGEDPITVNRDLIESIAA